MSPLGFLGDSTRVDSITNIHTAMPGRVRRARSCGSQGIMRRIIRDERGGIGFIILCVLAVCFAVGPLVLHFGQKTHDELPLVVADEFPADREIVPGEVFATTLAEIVRHELDGTTGWRPNDFFLWGPWLMADNNASRQLGIIQAVRESSRVLKDHLTKVSSDNYDDNLVKADTEFRNDAEKFWLPSAEGKYRTAVGLLDTYVAGLRTTPPTSRPMNLRNVEAIRLFQAWTDVLGGAHANLFKSEEEDGSAIMPWRADDYFYHAQGNAHVMYHLTRALRREYASELEQRPTVAKLFDEVAVALGKAAVLKPIIIMNGGSASLLANHRRNLDVYISEARQKMYSIREELEK